MRAFIHPREVFRFAIEAAAASIILVHNHPSGDPAPSPEDIHATKQLVEAGKLLQISVTDSRYYRGRVLYQHEGRRDNFVTLYFSVYDLQSNRRLQYVRRESVQSSCDFTVATKLPKRRFTKGSKRLLLL